MDSNADTGGVGKSELLAGTRCAASQQSSSSSSTTSSPPRYSDDVRYALPRPQHVLPSHGSSTKAHVVDSEHPATEEERDVFSPLSAGSNSESNNSLLDQLHGAVARPVTVCNGGGVITASISHTLDNKVFGSRHHKPVSAALMNATKEEKQRQNEEIVTMETSSLSSETGSWESVFPHANASLATGGAPPPTIDCDKLHNVKEKSQTPPSNNLEHASSACFIDASSLRDEDELLSFPSTQPDENAKPLETFHKMSTKCKSKTKALPDVLKSNCSNSSSSSNSETDSPHKMSAATSKSANNNTHNLSDEEKLWKRDNVTTKMPFSAKQTAAPMAAEKDDEQKQQFSTYDDATEASVSLAAEIDSSDSSEIIKHRRNSGQERKPAAVYALQPFSVHPLSISPKFAPYSLAAATVAAQMPLPPNAGCSDLSYTTDYSSSSPAPSLVWSEHENRPRPTDDLCYETAGASCLLPETPHNSIVQIDNNNTSNASSIHRDYTLSSSLSHQRDSGAYCSDATDSPVPLPRTPRRTKCDEANAIVSGGASIEDHVQKACDSPALRRRTDTCPIVSGGFVSLDFEPTSRQLQSQKHMKHDNAKNKEEEEEEEVELRVKSKPRSMASWVVDMSDCYADRRKSISPISSMETRRQRERCDSTSSHKSSSSASCGFYVSLDEKSELATPPPTARQLSKSYTAQRCTGFFVNLSQSDSQPAPPPAPAPATATILPTQPPTELEVDKKQMFSLFIDIGEKKNCMTTGPRSLAQRFSAATSQKRIDDNVKSTASSTETLMSRSTNNKAPINPNETENDTHLIPNGKSGSEAPLTVAALRRSAQQRRQLNTDTSKRHSWGDYAAKEESGIQHDYKRSISLTNAGGSGNGGLMCIIDKLPLISQTALAANGDNYLSPGDVSMSNTNLSISSGAEDESGTKPIRVKLRQRDAQLNQTYDKSSLASISDSLLSKDLSPASTTDTDDLTFQQDEELAMRESAPLLSCISRSTAAQMMETIMETKETSPKKLSTATTAGHTMETLHATIEKQKMLLETVNEHSEVVGKSAFVKLSDLDKPVKHELHSPEALMSKSVGVSHRSYHRLYRDEIKGGRPHSWTMTRSTGNSFLNITNSVDNLRSLSRLFPHFSKEISNSLPNDMILDHMEYVATDLSGDSSLASSFSRSAMDESSISCRQPRRLGEDLLKMFLQEIATDMFVEVHGRRIRAHKCILRSRCQYFAAMLAGNESQSIVSLHGYSYSAVHFALCHIYSGASHPPDGISLMELAGLADLLGLEGLKEVTAHALKINYCHNFHKPCSGCIDGILQVLPVALNHALDDLYRKCLRWTCRHYQKVWATRQFAQLPSDIMGRCRQQIVAYMVSCLCN